MKSTTTKPAKTKIPKLPTLLARKIYKTGQTRGADDDEIYQNRVSRTSTVLIPYRVAAKVFFSLKNNQKFEQGYIVLISPHDYFSDKNITKVLESQHLELGVNLLIFYETRSDWNSFHPDKYNFKEALSRTNPLGGQFVARVPATTAIGNGHKINLGFHTTKPKGAGIRYYEYASESTVSDCRFQLESLFWLCSDSEKVAQTNGMSSNEIEIRKKEIFQASSTKNLLDFNQLVQARILNINHRTVCPLCLEELSANGFFSKMEQAEGREVSDLTITQLNLFHINELKLGELNHRPYNLGWGHHHCNVVVKDSGIVETLAWMESVIKQNKKPLSL